MNRLKRSKAFRFLLCYFRIPAIYLFRRGHIRKRGWLSVDAQGEYIPWLTYPIIDYLDNLDITQCTVFEFGAGASTLWWSKRAKRVVSVEMEKDWCDHVKQLTPENVEIHHCPDGGLYPTVINTFPHSFDVIVVDGAERYKSAYSAIHKLSGRGLIILDNADWYPNTAKLLTENGFFQIDFYGFSPNNSFPHCSSLFFKNPAALAHRKAKSKEVIGGKQIKGGALDDG